MYSVMLQVTLCLDDFEGKYRSLVGQKSPGDSSHVHVPPYLLDKGFAKVFQKSKII